MRQRWPNVLKPAAYARRPRHRYEMDAPQEHPQNIFSRQIRLSGVLVFAAGTGAANLLFNPMGACPTCDGLA